MTTSLTPIQRDSLAQQLQQQLIELGDELRTERDGARDSAESLRDSGVHDKGEESAANSVIAVERAMIHQHEGERAKVRAALERLRDDRYGDCVQCGLAISYARLTIEPSASRCISCQQDFESH